MSIFEYLQIVTFLLNDFITKLDECYENAVIRTYDDCVYPKCFVIDEGELKIFAKQKHLKDFWKSEYIIKEELYSVNETPGYFDIISDRGSIYTLNYEEVLKAKELCSYYANFVKVLSSRISFYDETSFKYRYAHSIIDKYIIKNDEYILEIMCGLNNVYYDIRRKKFLTLDFFNIDILKECNMPFHSIPSYMSEYMQAKNISHYEFKKEELYVYKKEK